MGLRNLGAPVLGSGSTLDCQSSGRKHHHQVLAPGGAPGCWAGWDRQGRVHHRHRAPGGLCSRAGGEARGWAACPSPGRTETPVGFPGSGGGQAHGCGDDTGGQEDEKAEGGSLRRAEAQPGSTTVTAESRSNSLRLPHSPAVSQLLLPLTQQGTVCRAHPVSGDTTMLNAAVLTGRRCAETVCCDEASPLLQEDAHPRCAQNTFSRKPSRLSLLCGAHFNGLLLHSSLRLAEMLL